MLSYNVGSRHNVGSWNRLLLDHLLLAHLLVIYDYDLFMIFSVVFLLLWQ
jgi:hypothetical protein